MRALIGVVLLTVLALLALWGWRALGAEMLQPASTATPVRIQVLPGMGLRAILQRLERQGAVRHARLIALYVRLHPPAPLIQAGLYEIAPHASAAAVLDQLANGRVVLEHLTVVEGWSFAQLRRALAEDAEVGHTLAGLSDAQVMSALGHAGEPAEGRFFPDTYRFAAGTPDRKVLQVAYERMQAELANAWAGRGANLPLTTPTEALILASIIEKETGREDERAKVAAVFVNRLRRGMRLQSDPTVIYGLGEHYDGDIHSRDLSADTPYNTYTRAGLPPTPIALPGAAALAAAVNPAPIDALYFVATGDGDGGHHFSSTLAEQDVAVRHYLGRIGARAGAQR
jgi:UPF0755 protein